MMDVSFQDETDISMNISIDLDEDENNNQTKSISDTVLYSQQFESTSNEETSASLQDTSAPPVDAASALKKYECDQCGFSSKFRGNLSRHKKAVHERKKFKCDVCDKTYIHLSNLKEHLRTVHHNMPYLCEYCSKTRSSQKSLSLHRKIVHEGKEFFKCSVCGKVMLNKEHFEGHMNKHNDTKQFQCRLCSKKFFYKSSLGRHILRCSGNNPEKFKCDICQKILGSNVALKDHKQGKHEKRGQMCKCGKTYKWRTALARHRRKCEFDKL